MKKLNDLSNQTLSIEEIRAARKAAYHDPLLGLGCHIDSAVTVGVSVSREDREHLYTLARASGHTVSSLVRKALRLAKMLPKLKAE